MHTSFLHILRANVTDLSMRRLPKWPLRMACIVACVLALSVSSHAQGSAYLYAWVPGPDSNPAPADYGYVEQSNGHLHLEIPLGEPRQNRSGGGTTQARLVYDSNFWYPNQQFAPGYSWFPGTSWHVLPQPTSYGSMGTPGGNYWGETDEEGVPHYFTCSANCYSTEGHGYWFDGWDVYGPDGSLQVIDVPNSVYNGVVDANGNYTTVNKASAPPVYGTLNDESLVDTLGMPYFYWYETGFLGQQFGNVGPYVDDTYVDPSMSSSGANTTYLSHQVTIQVSSAFHMTRVPVAECVNSGSNTCTTNVVSQIVLPDGTSFSFKYDCDSTVTGQTAYCTSPGGQAAYYGGLTQMTIPTGRIFTYTYQTFFDSYQDATLGLASRSNGDGTWHYSQAAATLCGSVTSVGCTQTMTTVEPNGRTEITTNTMNNGAWPTSVLVSDGAGHNLASTATTFDFSHPNLWLGYASAYIQKQSETQTFWDNLGAAETKKTAYTYDSPQKGNVTKLQQWGYRSGTNPSFPSVADVTTYTNYYAPANNPQPDVSPFISKGGTNIINKPTSTTVCNNTGVDAACPGGGTRVSQQLIAYDQYGGVGPASVTGVTNHDDHIYGNNQSVRGNPTSVSQWVSGSQYVTKYMTYDTTGQVTSSTDGNGNLTQYDYSDNYRVDNGTSSPGIYLTASQTHAHPTTVTSPPTSNGTFVTKMAYYYGNQKTAFTTDYNGNNTTYNYTDPLDRLTQVTYPLGWALTRYTSPTQRDVYQSLPLSNPTPSIACTGCLHTSTTLDGLQRVVQTIRPDGSKIDRTYNAMGQVQTVSNPYFNTSDPTYGLTSYAYDIMGRFCLQNNPDNNLGQVTTCGNKGSSALAFSYVLNGGYKIDESGSTWGFFYNPLGQLSSVSEPNGATTQYSYDVLGNLLGVTQAGVPLSGDTPRVRSFAYDGLSRLLTSTNPESGTICYGQWSGGSCINGYDANSNLLHQTDARGIQINYTYDSWNRLTGKQSTGSTGIPAFGYSYHYDAFTPAQPNLIGRLAWTQNNVNATKTYSYDAMGRETGHTFWRLPAAGPPWVSYTDAAAYDLAGNVTDLTYPDGRHVSQTRDGAGRLSNSGLVDIGGVPQSQSYLTSATYNPDGSANVLTLGDGVQQTVAKNNRLQVQSLVVSATNGPMNATTFLSHSYCFVGCTTGGTANNGDIWGITDTLKATSNQGFTYDSLNRIGSFYLGGALKQKYDIDSFGNMSFDAGGFPVTTFDPATNRINNLPCATSLTPYDPAGEQVCSTDSNGAVSHYAYDANGQISQIALLGYESSPFVSYSYDANGTRVRKSNAAGPATEYFDFAGQPMAEKDQAGSWTDYIYANGQKIAKVDSTEARLHTSGTYSVNGVVSTWSLPAPTSEYPIKHHDKLVWKQYETGVAGGGLVLWMNNMSLIVNYQLFDQDGQWMNHDQVQNQWHTRVVDLDPYYGSTISLAQLVNDTYTGPGAWNVWYKDIVLVSTDGSSIPIYTGQASASLPFWSNDPNPSAQHQTVDVASTTPNGSALGGSDTTHYYLNDHLGSAQMELTAGGWPVWEGQFAPFGQELVNGALLPPGQADSSSTRYKFTGKERDAESGLDYFGARYYGSNVGRFMSPDWAAKAEPVPYAKLDNPQSLNLYAYVGSNPLGSADADGHDVVVDNPADRAQVQSDIQKLDPGAKIDDDGNVKKPGFWQTLWNYLDGNGAGTALVNGLINSSTVTHVGLSNDGNGSTDQRPDGGINVTYDPNGAMLPTRLGSASNSPIGDVLLPGQIVLGHELIHATHNDFTDVSGDHHFAEGLIHYTEREQADELRTVGFSGFTKHGDITENQLRRQFGYNPRAAYDPRNLWNVDR